MSVSISSSETRESVTNVSTLIFMILPCPSSSYQSAIGDPTTLTCTCKEPLFVQGLVCRTSLGK